MKNINQTFRPAGKLFFLNIALLSVAFSFAQTAPDNPVNAEAPGSNPAYMNVFVVPGKDLIVIQWKNLNTEDREIILADSTGREIRKETLYQGSTIVYFDTQTLYSGEYTIMISDGRSRLTEKIKLFK